MTRPDEIQWEDWMVSQVCRERSFPAIRPAAPEPSDPSFNRVDVSALIARTHTTKALSAGETK